MKVSHLVSTLGLAASLVASTSAGALALPGENGIVIPAARPAKRALPDLAHMRRFTRASKERRTSLNKKQAAKRQQENLPIPENLSTPLTVFGSDGSPKTTIMPTKSEGGGEAPPEGEPTAKPKAPAPPPAEGGASAADCQVASPETDVLVVNFALTLELLETTFYLEALSKFSKNDFKHAGFSDAQATILIETLQVIAFDENAHVEFLQGALLALGQTANAPCQFDFSAALVNPEIFLATARALEQVGVSAYEGGIGLLSSKSILTAAAGIHAIEARHSTVLNILSAGTPVPQAFDMPLLPQQVLALAGGFLTGCKATDLGLETNQPLAVRNARTGSTIFRPGDQLTFISNIVADSSQLFCAIMVGGKTASTNLPLDQCFIPFGTDGPVYVFITSSATPLAADVTVQDTTTTLAGPGLIFVEGENFLIQSVFSANGGKQFQDVRGKKPRPGQEGKDKPNDKAMYPDQDNAKLVDQQNKYKEWKSSEGKQGESLTHVSDNRYKSYPPSDLGYVNVCVQSGQVKGDSNGWWQKHPIAVWEQVGSEADVVGWSKAPKEEGKH